MSKVCIMQPQFFPWVGLLEQIKLADVFIFGDDFKLPGNFNKNFYNRVQIKTPNITEWLTVPLNRKESPSKHGLLNEMKLFNDNKWRIKHYKTLRNNYSKAPYFQDLMIIVENVYNNPDNKTLADLAIDSTMELVRYFDLDNNTEFYLSSELNITTRKEQRVLDILSEFNTVTYITGEGGMNYLNIDSFNSKGISVELMQYMKTPYCQLFGEFTPYVSSLDLVANMGKAGHKYIMPVTKKL